LKSRGYVCEVVKHYYDLFKYDWVLSHVLFHPNDLRVLKSAGKLVVYDFCEGVFDAQLDNNIKNYSFVACSSPKLVEESKKRDNHNATWVHDSYETT
jgi:hypothetical protein